MLAYTCRPNHCLHHPYKLFFNFLIHNYAISSFIIYHFFSHLERLTDTHIFTLLHFIYIHTQLFTPISPLLYPHTHIPIMYQQYTHKIQIMNPLYTLNINKIHTHSIPTMYQFFPSYNMFTYRIWPPNVFLWM